MSEIDDIIEAENPDLDLFEIELKKLNRKERKGKQKEMASKLWGEAGWHRPLGGFWFNYILLLVIAIPAIAGFALLNMVLPFPEALGFANVTTAYLMPLYLFADFGIREAVKRYVAQYSETETRKAISYLSFYIWYQVFTGIIQVTIISILAVAIIPNTSISYAVWFFLVYIMIQWPGTAGIFLVALGGFQQFDKQNVLVVIQNVAIQTATQIIFIIIGRAWGALHPETGELMGAVMGFIFGSYLDDLITMIIGLYFFKKILEPYGISIGETFHISFDKQIIKEVLVYGGKVLPSGLSYVGVNAIITYLVTSYLWNYPYWMGVYYIASGLISALGVSFSNTEPIAEAYNTGRKELALYYIKSQFFWWGFLSIAVLMAPILFLIPPIVANLMPEYVHVTWMVFPLFLGAFILFPSNFSGVICQACDLPQHSTYMNFIEQGTRFITYLIILAPWGFLSWFGEMAVIYGWLFAEAPGYALKGVYGWWIVKRKLFPNNKIRIPWYRTFVATTIPMILMTPIYLFILRPFIIEMYLVNEIIAYVLAVIYLLGVLFIIPIYIIMPIYGLLGAWDEYSLNDFHKAAIMSGPSKFVVMALYKNTKWGYERSRFKNRFVIPYEIADNQAKEITNIRKEQEIINLNLDKDEILKK